VGYPVSQKKWVFTTLFVGHLHFHFCCFRNGCL
jgi:hypothetical protein